MNENKMITPITGAEAEKLTNSLMGYHTELQSRLWKYIVDEYGANASVPLYSMETTPVPNHLSFSYDKGRYDLDHVIDDILKELSLKYFPQNQ